MRLIRSFILAVSMYSRLPAPRVGWTEENMRYSLAFFPAVGIFIGGLELAWYGLYGRFGFTNLAYAAGGCLIPLLVTGGIHMDGFCDTQDALASCASREKKLGILKDPHSGAFAIIRCMMYLLAYTGAMSLMDSWEELLALAAGYVLSRAGSGFAAVVFPSSNPEGSLASFSSASDKRAVRAALFLTAAACMGFQIWIAPAAGLFASAAAVVLFFYYYKMAKEQFGGINGDLAGWFLQSCELAILLAVAAGSFLAG